MPFIDVFDSGFRTAEKVCLLAPGPNGRDHYSEIPADYQVLAISNAFAVGELYFGAGRGFRHLVGLTVGTGLGAGVVVDGRLYSGANCGAGELGAMPYRDHTIEYYCSGAFFQRVAGIRGEEAFRRAENGDAAAIELFEQLGHELGHAVMVALYAYDPELIVLGGSISVALRFFERPMRERLREYPWPQVVERLHIAASAVENAAILGAAALWIDATNGAPRLNRGVRGSPEP